MSTSYLDLHYRHFVVDERPLCLWDIDIQKQNLSFLENTDPSYFEYMANTHLSNIGEGDETESKQSQHAALALRTIYSQALETLFAFLCAGVQAPYCVPAWINAYKNLDLRSMVDKIQHRRPVLSGLQAQVLTWSSIAEFIFTSFVLEDKEKEAAIKVGFAQLWSRFASDFLGEEFTEEYNSIKHGLRVRPGGFHISIGREEIPGVAAPSEKMRLLGKSEFGSSYLVSEKIGDLNYHIRLKRNRRNWSPEDIFSGIVLATWSISNVVSALEIMNGVSAEHVQFNWPKDPSAFQKPWIRSSQMGVTAMSGFDVIIEPELIDPFSKEEILADYKAGQDAGTRRILFGNSPPGSGEDTQVPDETGTI